MKQLPANRMADALILIAIAVFFVFNSWQKWADPIIDFGREVYIPWRINHGETLYKDLAFPYGAFPPYWNAFLFKLFGPSILLLCLFNILISLLNTALIYRFLDRVFDRLTALTAGISFLVLFVFNQYFLTHNMFHIAAYSHSYFYALFFCLCSMNVLISFLNRPGYIKIFFLGLLAGFTILSRLEIFLAFFIPCWVGLILFFIKMKYRIPDALSYAALFLLGLLIPVLTAMVYFLPHFSLGQSFNNVVGYNPAWREVSQMFFYRKTAGLTDAPSQLKTTLRIIADYACLYGSFVLFCFSCRLKNYRVLKFLSGGLFLATAIFFACKFSSIKHAIDIFRPMALFVIVLFLLQLKKIFNSSNSTQLVGPIAVSIVCWFALIMLFKIPLATSLIGYGLIYGVPATLLSVALLTHEMPACFERKFHIGGMSQGLALMIVGVVCLCISVHSLSWMKAKSIRISDGPNTIWTFKSIRNYSFGNEVGQFLNWSEENMKPHETFVTYPVGVMLNFLTGHLISGQHVTFMPVEEKIYTAGSMIRPLTTQPPDYVVYLNRDLSNYGFANIESIGNFRFDQWVKANYQSVWQAGNTQNNNAFKITVFKKNPDTTSYDKSTPAVHDSAEN